MMCLNSGVNLYLKLGEPVFEYADYSKTPADPNRLLLHGETIHETESLLNAVQEQP